MHNHNNDYFTPRGLRTHYNFSRTTYRRLMEQGLPHVRISERVIRHKRDQIEKFFAARTAK